MIEIIVLSRTDIAEHDIVSKQVIENEPFHRRNLWSPRHQEAEFEIYVWISDYSGGFRHVGNTELSKERRAAKMCNPNNFFMVVAITTCEA